MLQFFPNFLSSKDLSEFLISIFTVSDFDSPISRLQCSRFQTFSAPSYPIATKRAEEGEFGIAARVSQQQYSALSS